MKCNVGGIDKLIRLGVGIAGLGISLLAPISSVWKMTAFVVALIALVTASFGFCPLNKLLGINSCNRS